MFARFWARLVAFFFGGIFGTIFGIALGFFFFPYVFPPPPATEQLTQADLTPPAAAGEPASPAMAEQAAPAPAGASPSASPPSAEQSAGVNPAPAATSPAAAPRTAAAVATAVATGSFIHANKSDPVHWGKGKVSVYQRVVFLEPDFEVGPGPAFHVYLVPKPSIRSSSDMKDVMYVDLGRLRAFKGSQRYQIPDGVNLKDFPSVIIWCERFGVLISPADLKVVQAMN